MAGHVSRRVMQAYDLPAESAAGVKAGAGWHVSCTLIPSIIQNSKDRDIMPVPTTVTEQGFRLTAGRLRQRFRGCRLRLKDMIREDIQSVPGLMALLMKPRNGERWTPGERLQLVNQLKSLSRISLAAVLTVLPGSILVLPLLAWWLDRRRTSAIHALGRRATDPAHK